MTLLDFRISRFVSRSYLRARAETWRLIPQILYCTLQRVIRYASVLYTSIFACGCCNLTASLATIISVYIFAGYDSTDHFPKSPGDLSSGSLWRQPLGLTRQLSRNHTVHSPSRFTSRTTHFHYSIATLRPGDTLSLRLDYGIKRSARQVTYPRSDHNMCIAKMTMCRKCKKR